MASGSGMGEIDHDELARLHPLSFGWARSCCRYDDDEAEAVLQDAYLKTLDGRARYAGRASLKTWFFAVIRRTAQERARTRSRHASLFAQYLRQAALDPASGAVAHLAPTAGADPDFEAALNALPPRQRELVHLVFYQDLTIDEAAGVMGVSKGSARTHYARGVSALRARLNAEAAA